MSDPTSSAAVRAIAKPWPTYKRLLAYSMPHWRVIVLASLATAALAAVDAGFAALVKPLLDKAFVEQNPGYIRTLPLLIIGLFLLRAVSSFGSTYGMSWVARRVVKDVRGQLFDKLLGLPVRYYDRVSSSQLIARLTYHVEQVADAASTVLTGVLKDTLTIVFYIGLMTWLNWKLTVFVFVVAPFIALIIRYVSKRFRSISGRIQDSVSLVTEVVDEAVHGQRVIKVSNSQQMESDRFDRANELNRWLSMKVVATKAGSSGVIQVIAALAVAAIVYFATQPSMIDSMSAGTFAAFMLAMMSLTQPMKNMGNVNERLQRGIAAAAEIFETLDQPPEPLEGAHKVTRARGQLTFENVSFAYPGTDVGVLHNINLAIEAGQTVAFVGRSGSGKSTLLSLLPRFYDVDQGRIRLDGVDLRDYDLRDLRNQFALVDQQVRLFSASVAENIAYGISPPPAREKIIDAARRAHAWEFIEKLPQGLETPLGQNGAGLSGGQKQRLAIARALLRDAPILILDEATSALDSESERLIQAALENLVGGRTTLTIAHRLSTIQNADLIVAMQDGQMVEAGSHSELIARNGLYAALHRLQFDGGH
ncbi:lipid A export permease/ATP-binding protein MsbA [Sinimarinibacterium sp. NLF-5-8]|uniref:lipid A export permease/ATP-binding protein MsbA n=1 Tax=Sinimarinibacterium sp. NLF-5-8 TaxID=2698684 RepID=UPI00137BED48|nr:lipid A export permease/ATP-binding protein MsbA [Sinimarinibacterium sp. NLF-5-8]QHS08951.1 lipid A export permease/ATP-binding protein MsbA [Sinimarinibacterium sp. NLF-5-8]